MEFSPFSVMWFWVILDHLCMSLSLPSLSLFFTRQIVSKIWRLILSTRTWFPVCQSVCLSVFLFVFLAVFLSSCLSVCRFVCPSIGLSLRIVSLPWYHPFNLASLIIAFIGLLGSRNICLKSLLLLFFPFTALSPLSSFSLLSLCHNSCLPRVKTCSVKPEWKHSKRDHTEM